MAWMVRVAALVVVLVGVVGPVAWGQDGAGKKKVVLVAGRKSHGFGAHDHKAGCHLLAKRLNESGLVQAVVVEEGWPKDNAVFEGAAAIVVYADGGNGHPAIPHLDYIQGLMDKGVGFGAIHYGVEVPKGKPGEKFLEWNGGYFETHWSVNPHWTATYREIPKHEVTRGVRPFATNDEWYYHMRFRPEMRGVTALLYDVPPEGTRGKEGANLSHGGNPHVQARKGQPEVTTWVAVRENGGRGFGTTGGHWHWNWAQDDFRRLILNCIVWIAKAEVPEKGVENEGPDYEEMVSNHDDKPEKFNEEQIRKRVEQVKGMTVEEKN